MSKSWGPLTLELKFDSYFIPSYFVKSSEVNSQKIGCEVFDITKA